MDNNGALEYLVQYGYVDDGQKSSFFSPDRGLVGPMKKALLEFQSFFGIRQTGVLDTQTSKMMMSPRCGVSDRIRYDKQSNRLYFPAVMLFGTMD